MFFCVRSLRSANNRFHSQILTALLLAAVVSAANPSSSQAEEIARWDFNSDEVGWTANDQAELKVADGSLTIRSRGNDPWFATKVEGRAGQHQLAITARMRGKTDIQVFWTTDKDGATSEEKSTHVELVGSENEWRTAKLWFETTDAVTSLRIDPTGRRGEIQIDSIVLTDEAAPIPQATPVADIKLLPGFQVELLYSVPAEQMGSWVSMTHDPKGRLIVSDQYGKLYRVTPPAIGSNDAIQIENIDVEIGMAQGLLCAFDSLYVMVNGTDAEKQGLYRVRDTDNDDKYDSVEWLRKINGGGEHGPHAIVLSPDGQSLFVCAGNHTKPTEFSTSRVPRNWDEDQLLPRMWDAGGHAVGILAPGGWIARVSPDGKDWELYGSGFRNEYDIAFNAEGELFTYDADMEWDVGSPWYRPTRVNHVTSGSEFGWRSGTGKWPVWSPDSLGSVVDIGPGSPTGIAFGTGAKFPAKYQRSLFISDWSYGVIYAVHMTPKGSTYIAEAERFVSAAPLPATDIVINPVDQAMYFTIGGRKTQSGLYRVTYAGTESTVPATVAPDKGTELRELRHKIESLHTSTDGSAVEKAWKYLGHPDRNIRFAARIAVEQQPVSSWQQAALDENTSSESKINALLALVRNGDKALQIPVLESLARLDAKSLTEEQQLAALRVISLCFIRMGEPDAEVSRDVAGVLNGMYPSSSLRLNRELCALLVYLNHGEVAGKTLDLLAKAPTQQEQIHYALCLRALKRDQWTMDQRKQYFQWFVTTATMRGGNSFPAFLKNIRQEAIDKLTDDDKVALKEVLDARPTSTEVVVEAASRPFVREWKVSDLLADVSAGLKGRDLDNGRRMFTATACFKCHRFAGDGGIVGPDLTAVARRYNAQTMLESLLEPSKVVSDQYEATVFVLDSGKQVIGRVVNLNGDRLMVSENMLDPGKMTNVLRSEIEETFVSKTSMMPNGLLNNLTKDEVLDLIAYLQAGGEQAAAVEAVSQTPEPKKKEVPMFTDAGHTTDELTTIQQRVAKNEAILLDVREQDEWDSGHLKAAHLVPLSKLKDGQIPAEFVALFPKDKPIYLHCRSGGRVLMCAEVLAGKGYDIRPMKAGYEKLVESGFEKAAK